MKLLKLILNNEIKFVILKNIRKIIFLKPFLMLKFNVLLMFIFNEMLKKNLNFLKRVL